MPTADFSEFSYGYAVVREAEIALAAAGAALSAAPTLPSLLRENTVGYDAHLVTVNFALFLQFKRSFFVSRQHTQGWCGYSGADPHCTWAYWAAEHYRFDVESDSNQFAAMRGYEADIDAGRRSGLSLYVAPAFHRDHELHHAYLSGTVLDRSAGIKPSAFDAVPAGAHQFSFMATLGAGVVTSEPAPTAFTPLRSTIGAAATAALIDPPRDGLTLASLGTWVQRSAESLGLLTDFDRQSAVSTLRSINDYAGLLGGTMIIIGRPDAATPDPSGVRT